MELESCQNPAHTQNVFCSRITIHTHTKRVLLTQNDSHTRSVWFANTKHHSHHKLMHFASETNTVCFTQSTKKNPSSTQNNSTSTEHESCAWIGMHLRTDRNAFAHGSARRKISAKSHVTNKCPVIHTTQQRWRCSCQTARIPYGFRAV